MAANARGIRAGRAFVELGVNDKIQQGLRRAQMRLRAFGAGVRAVGAQMAAMAAVPTAALGLAVRHFASAGDVLDKMSQRTGISVEALSELGFAAEQSGADLQVLEKGVRTLQRSINDAERGLSTATDALSDLGLTAEQFRGLTPEEQFKLVAEALSRIEDPSKRAALAMQLLGRAGTQLLPLMQNGARGIEELQEQARSLGLTVSTETAKEAALLNDTLNILWRVVKQGVFVIGSALAPAVISLTNAVVRAVVTVTQWVRENKALIVTVAKVVAGVAAAGIALIGLGVLISGVGAVFGVLAGVVGAVGTALGFIGTVLAALLSPIGLVVAAVVGLGTALLVWSGAGGKALAWLRDRFDQLREFVGKVAGGIADALAAGDIRLAAEVLWLGLRVVWLRGALELSKVWSGVRSAAIENVLGALGVIEAAWINTTAFLSKTWTAFAASFSRVWNIATAFVAKRMLEIQGLFDSGLDVEAAKRALDDQLESRLAEIEGRAAGDIESRERKRVKALRDLWQDVGAAQAAAESGAGDAVEESQRELDEARRRLDEALAEARARRDGLGSEPIRGAGILEGLDEMGERIARGLDVRGTFSARALQGLAATGNSADRTAKATEETAKNTKRLLAAARSGGLAFG